MHLILICLLYYHYVYKSTSITLFDFLDRLSKDIRDLILSIKKTLIKKLDSGRVWSSGDILEVHQDTSSYLLTKSAYFNICLSWIGDSFSIIPFTPTLKEQGLPITTPTMFDFSGQDSGELLLSGLFYQDINNDLTYIHTQFIVMVILAAVLYFLSKLLSKKIFNLDKKSAYECGFEPFLILTTFIEVGFILVAFIFLIFDLELIFLSAFLVSSGSIGSFGILLVFVYLLSVWVMVFFEVFSGVLSWPVWNIFSISSSFWFYSLFLKSRSWFGMVSSFSKFCLEYTHKSFEFLTASADVGEPGFEVFKLSVDSPEFLHACRFSVKQRLISPAKVIGSFDNTKVFYLLKHILLELGWSEEKRSEVFEGRVSELSYDEKLNKISAAFSEYQYFLGDVDQCSNADLLRILDCGTNEDYQYSGEDLICPIRDEDQSLQGLIVEYNSNSETEEQLISDFVSYRCKSSWGDVNLTPLLLITMLDYIELSLSCYGSFFFEPSSLDFDDDEPFLLPADIVFFEDSFGFYMKPQEIGFRFIADDLMAAMYSESDLSFYNGVCNAWVVHLDYYAICLEEICKKPYTGMVSFDYYINFLKTEYSYNYWLKAGLIEEEDEDEDEYEEVAPAFLLCIAICF